MKQKSVNVFLSLSAVLLLAAIILAGLSIYTVNSDKYNYYEDCYDESYSLYTRCMAEYYKAVYFKDSFKALANSARSTMHSWENKMDELEFQSTIFAVIAGVCFAASIGSGVVGFVNRKKLLAAAAAEQEAAAVESEVAETPVENTEPVIEVSTPDAE